MQIFEQFLTSKVFANSGNFHINPTYSQNLDSQIFVKQVLFKSNFQMEIQKSDHCDDSKRGALQKIYLFLFLYFKSVP